MSDTKVIIQLSDLHIVSSGNLHDSVDSLDNVSQILEVIEGLATPDLVLLTGDLADEGHPDSYKRLRPVIDAFSKKTGIPVMYLPGNHDKRPAFRFNLLDLEENEENTDQILWCGGLRVIGLDSTALDGPHGEFDDAQLDWLDAELNKPAPLGTIIAFHHPPIPGPIDAINLIILRNPERFSKIIEGRGVKMILAGHTHHASAGLLGNVPVWVATATAYQIDVRASDSGFLRGIPGSGFSRIDVTNDGAFATHIPMLPGEHHLYNIDLEQMKRYFTEKASAGAMEEPLVHSSAGE